MDKWHIFVEGATLILLGVPLWGGVIKIFSVFREYPPHVHDEKDVSRIKYPRGMEPSEFRKEGKIQ